MITIQYLTQEKFKKFGDLISAFGDERFQVLLEEPDAAGWRIAKLKVSREAIKALGLHPNTRETFVPLSGTSVLVVAQQTKPEEIQAYLLDQSVCIHKNVWHATIALSEKAYIGIAENAQVDQEEYFLKQPLQVGLAYSV